MTQATIRSNMYPVDAGTGLTLPLRESLGSQDLAKHRAMVGAELEVMAKKFNLFGWDQGGYAQDRFLTDWMDALQDYSLQEIQIACREWVRENYKMPNEGCIMRIIMARRAAEVAAFKARLPRQEQSIPAPSSESKRRVTDLLASLGYIKRVPQ